MVVEEADTFVTKYRKELEVLYREAPRLRDPAAADQAMGGDHEPGKAGRDAGCRSTVRARRKVTSCRGSARLRLDDRRPALEPAEARLLLELVGPESGVLVSELEKLSIYAGRNQAELTGKTS